MTDILIDPNVRVANDETYAGFEDVVGDFPREGSRVVVREPESDLVGHGVVTRVSEADELIYIAVDWAALAPAPVLTADELVRRVKATIGATLHGASPNLSPTQPEQVISNNRHRGALTAA